MKQLSGFAGVVLEQIERSTNDGIVFGGQLISAERRGSLVLSRKFRRNRGDLGSGHYTILENRFVLRGVVIGHRQDKGGAIFQGNDLLFGCGAKSAFANKIASVIVTDSRSNHLSGTGSAWRNKDSDRTAPHNFIGCGGEFLAGYGLTL